MAERYSHKFVKAMAGRLGFKIQTWAPGDGVRRYSFTTGKLSHYNCYGSREAVTFMSGYEYRQDEESVEAGRRQ